MNNKYSAPQGRPLEKAPLLPLTVAFIIGIAVCDGGISIYALVAVLAAGALFLLFNRLRAALVVCGVLVGMLTAEVRRVPEPDSNICGQFRDVSGVIQSYSERDEFTHGILAIDSIDGVKIAPIQADCGFINAYLQMAQGDRVAARIRLTPFDDSDYAMRLRRQGVYLRSLVHIDSVHSVRPEPGLINDAARVRDNICSVIDDMSLSLHSAVMLKALLVGERETMTEYHRDTFSRAGLAHILALSGLHVAIVTLVLTAMLTPITLLWGRKLVLAIVIIALWCYAVITGLSPSVVRSVIMATVFLGCFWLERRVRPVNALCVAALAILFVAPWQLFTLSFQLSFVAVISIVIFADSLNPIPKSAGPIHGIGAALATTLAAMLGTGLVSAYSFHTFPVYFLLANLPATFIMPPLLTFGILAIGLQAVGLPNLWLCKGVDFCVGVITSTAEFASSLPGAVIDNVSIHPAALIIGLLAIVSGAFYVVERKRVFGIATILGVIALTCGITIGQIRMSNPMPTKLYSLNDRDFAMLAIVREDTVDVVTSATPGLYIDVVQKTEREISRMFPTRTFRCTRILPERFRIEGGEVWRDGDRFGVNGTTFRLLGRDLNRLKGDSADVVIITPQFNADSITVVCKMDVKKALIVSGVRATVAKRIKSTLNSQGIATAYAGK